MDIPKATVYQGAEAVALHVTGKDGLRSTSMLRPPTEGPLFLVVHTVPVSRITVLLLQKLGGF